MKYWPKKEEQKSLGQWCGSIKWPGCDHWVTANRTAWYSKTGVLCCLESSPWPLTLLSAVGTQCLAPNGCMSSLPAVSMCWANLNHWFNCLSLSPFDSLRISTNVFGSDPPPHLSLLPPTRTSPTSIPQSVPSCLLSSGGIKYSQSKTCFK